MRVSPPVVMFTPSPPSQDDQGVYQDQVRELIRSNSHRLVVNINDLRRKNAKRAAK